MARSHGMGRRLAIMVLCASALSASPAASEQTVRIATYNIKFLNKDISGPRASNIKQVISSLDADIIGLQEIDDRAALQRVFDSSQWDLIIDDDSGNNQDVAVAIRHPLRAVSIPADMDADDEHFLFPGPQNDREFPNRRDLLRVQVSVPGDPQPVSVMVHHAKSRVGGRDATDPRREGAARTIVQKLEQEFDGKRFVLMGDCNDNPDDRSMNILESGQPNAPGGPEEIEGPFLLNLVEPLVVHDHVSWGLRAGSVVGDRIDTVKSGSRDRNNDERGTAGSVSPILFDQILIPVTMKAMYVRDSAKVFDDPVAVSGGPDAPSDHLPVFADFVFAQVPEPEPTPSPTAGVVIAELLPDPEGDDAGHEEVVLANGGTASADLGGWGLRDRAGNVLALSGSVAGGARKAVSIPAGKLPLNNGGDDIELLNAQGTVVHQVSYSREDVDPGVRVSFP